MSPLNSTKSEEDTTSIFPAQEKEVPFIIPTLLSQLGIAGHELKTIELQDNTLCSLHRHPQRNLKNTQLWLPP